MESPLPVAGPAISIQQQDTMTPMKRKNKFSLLETPVKPTLDSSKKDSYTSRDQVS